MAGNRQLNTLMSVPSEKQLSNVANYYQEFPGRLFSPYDLSSHNQANVFSVPIVVSSKWYMVSPVAMPEYRKTSCSFSL